MDINYKEISNMSEKEFSNLMKKLLLMRYPEANKIQIIQWTYEKNKPLDKISIITSYEF